MPGHARWIFLRVSRSANKAYVGLGDVAGVLSRFFIVGFFLPSFFTLISLAALFVDASGGGAILAVGAGALLIGLLLLGLRSPIWFAFEGYLLGRTWDPEKTKRKKNLPTAFAKATKAYRDRVERRWGIDVSLAWPYIESLFSDQERTLHDDARAEVHFFLNSCLGAFAIAGGIAADVVPSPELDGWNFSLDAGYWTLLLALAFAGAGYLLYRAAVGGAERWGKLKEAGVVLHRLELYQQFGLGKPRAGHDEWHLAERLNALLGPTVDEPVGMATHGEAFPLNRTREAAGSSPASSIHEGSTRATE